jgi:AcrR family transcriptional regulator
MTDAANAETNQVTRPRVGRPRSVESRRAIIQAAMTILQTDGYAALNIEAIAARAGVSKQTIYRWWASAAFIVLEALLADMPAQESVVPDTGSLKGDLLELVRPTVRALSQRRGPVFKALIAEAQVEARLRRRALDDDAPMGAAPVLEQA